MVEVSYLREQEKVEFLPKEVLRLSKEYVLFYKIAKEMAFEEGLLYPNYVNLTKNEFDLLIIGKSISIFIIHSIQYFLCYSLTTNEIRKGHIMDINSVIWPNFTCMSAVPQL